MVPGASVFGIRGGILHFLLNFSETSPQSLRLTFYVAKFRHECAFIQAAMSAGSGLGHAPNLLAAICGLCSLPEICYIFCEKA
jgi:hypothetical protein